TARASSSLIPNGWPGASESDPTGWRIHPRGWFLRGPCVVCRYVRAPATLGGHKGNGDGTTGWAPKAEVLGGLPVVGSGTVQIGHIVGPVTGSLPEKPREEVGKTPFPRDRFGGRSPVRGISGRRLLRGRLQLHLGQERHEFPGRRPLGRVVRHALAQH